MRMTPLVTVCVPTIGRMDYLPATIRSVAAQSYGNFEILVLDNASPPHAAKALDDWRAEDARVRVLRIDERIPMFANFNRGIRAAEGKYIVFFHDDDVYGPDLIERSVAALERSPRASFVGSNCDFIDEAGEIVEKRRWIKEDVTWSGRRYITDLITRGRNLVCMPGLMFRRDALGAGFDEKLSIHFGDFVLLMRWAEDREVCLVAEPLVRIRKHSEQASSSLPFSTFVELRTAALQKFCDEYVVRHPDEERFVRRLRRRIALTHRVHIGWAWLSATSAEEAAACTRRLGDTRFDAPLKSLMGSLERTGVRPHLGGGRLWTLARRVGPLLRL